MILNTNVTSELENAKAILDVFDKIESKANDIINTFKFFTIKDVVKMTGISEPKVQEIFNREDFPVCDYGRSKVVFAPAFYEYFMKAVKTTDFLK